MPITKINSLGITNPVAFSAGTVSLPSITFSGDTNTGVFAPAADTIAFTEGGAEAMRIDSSGNVGIGQSSPVYRLQVNSSANSSTTDALVVQNTGVNDLGSTTGIRFKYGGAEPAAIRAILTNQGSGAGALGFFTSSDGTGASLTERMRLDSSGNLLIGRSTTSFSTAGFAFNAGGSCELVRDNSEPLNINRLTSDGDLVNFYQASAKEGSISVSGATVSYNGFTGSHWSRFIDESKPDVLRGTVMESLDQMIDWYAVEFEVSTTENDEVKTHTEHKPYALKANEQEGDVITYNFEGTAYQATIVKEKDVKHVMSKISDTVEAKNVYGVFSAWDNDDLINNDFYVASVGSYVVRIKAGQTVSKGDLLQSNGDGTAKVQADDLIRASTFAKVLSNTVIDTYEDGSFIVPCSLMC